jgi:GntR family carbon starvation induced transcriptional regulator
MDSPINEAKENSVGTNKSGETLASAVYDRLLNDILNGTLTPDLKLRLQVLKTQYDVGNSPLREALNRLSEKGLVMREENKGFRVAPASEEQLKELIRTRCWLEEIALRESIKNGDDEWEEQVVLAFHRLSKSARYGEGEIGATAKEWEQRHSEYHRALVGACGSSLLLDYCIQLDEKTLRYRNLAAVMKHRDRHELDELRSMNEAAINSVAVNAVYVLNSYFDITLLIVLWRGCICLCVF